MFVDILVPAVIAVLVYVGLFKAGFSRQFVVVAGISALATLVITGYLKPNPPELDKQALAWQLFTVVLVSFGLKVLGPKEST